MLSRPTKRTGFTLLELAVVLVIVSLMTGFAVEALQGNAANSCYDTTRAQMRDIQSALSNFTRANNRLPKPALSNIGVSDPNYGKEVTSNSDVDSYGADPANPTVLFGALPFATLGLPSSYAADCWGNKFNYNATLKLTDTATYMNNTNKGAVTVRTGTIASATTISSMAAYTVISAGENALGASAANYVNASRKNCNSESSSRVDKENCDTGNDIIFAAPFNNGSAASASFFDDLVIYADKTGYTGCQAQLASWTQGGVGPCSAPISALDNGASQAGVANTNTSSFSGSATVTCTNGTLTATGSCAAVGGSCSAQTVNWNTNCAGSVTTLNHGQSVSVTNTATNYTGSVTATCNSGVISQGSPTCTPTASCSAQSISWNTNCSGTTSGIITHGGSSSITNTASGYSGSATASCSNGVLSATGTCTALANCTAQTVTWNTNCSGSSGTVAHGGGATVSNTVGGYSGSVPVTCNNGTLTKGSGTCTAGTCSGTVSWGSCSGTVSLSEGTSTSVSNSASGYTGTATASCSGGTATATGSCNANCSAQTISWGTSNACSASIGALNHGDGSATTNTAGGATGSVTATCSNGTIQQSGASCSASCIAPDESKLVWSAPYGGQCYCGGVGVPSGCTGGGGGGTSFQSCTDENAECYTQLSSCGAGGTGCEYGPVMGRISCQKIQCIPGGDGHLGMPPSYCCNGDANSDTVCDGAPACSSAGTGCTMDGSKYVAGVSSCCNSDSDGDGICGGAASTCTDICGNGHNQGTSWCVHNQEGGVDERMQCDAGGATSINFDSSCGQPDICGASNTMIPAATFSFGTGCTYLATESGYSDLTFTPASGKFTCPNGSKFVLRGEPFTWQDMGTYWWSGEYPENASAVCISGNCNCIGSHAGAQSCMDNQSGGTWEIKIDKSTEAVTATHHS